MLGKRTSHQEKNFFLHSIRLVDDILQLWLPAIPAIISKSCFNGLYEHAKILFFLTMTIVHFSNVHFHIQKTNR